MGGLLLRLKGEMIMNTPLIVKMERAKTSIVEFVNNIMQQEQLPCYLLEPTISQIYTQIKEGARNELEMAKQQKKDEVVE